MTMATDPAARALRRDGQRYASSEDDDARIELIDSLDALSDVLLPHLDREVADAMPVVSRILSQSEWRAIEHKHNVKPKPLAQLGFDGHWLLDGIEAEGREVVTHTVHPIPRFILLHGFARSYRRRSALVWGPDPSSVPSRTTGVV
jgi:hypothetical protein